MTLLMEMKGKLDTVLHQQQIILQELGRTRYRSTPRIPSGFSLPAQSFDDVQTMEKKLQSSSLDKQSLVSLSNLIFTETYNLYSLILLFDFFKLRVEPEVRPI